MGWFPQKLDPGLHSFLSGGYLLNIKFSPRLGLILPGKCNLMSLLRLSGWETWHWWALPLGGIQFCNGHVILCQITWCFYCVFAFFRKPGFLLTFRQTFGKSCGLNLSIMFTFFLFRKLCHCVSFSHNVRDLHLHAFFWHQQEKCMTDCKILAAIVQPHSRLFFLDEFLWCHSLVFRSMLWLCQCIFNVKM